MKNEEVPEAPATPALDEMLAGLRDSQTVPTKLEAGQVLSRSGWCLFPLPDNMKNDWANPEEGLRGPALSHFYGTTDPGVFTEMAESVMSRHECRDVNLAIVPARCTVPLLGIDLDGAPAIEAFRTEAWSRGHADLGMWLRVNTTRKDEGRHVYFVSPEGRAFRNGSHKWGGEIRSGKGHLVFPPSTTALGRYTLEGSLLKEAPDWVVSELNSSPAVSRYRQARREQLGEWLDSLSAVGWTSYAEVAVENLLQEMRDARAGDVGRGRNPTLARVINRVLDLALDGELPALEALERVKDQYVALFDQEETVGRNLGGEFVRCVEAWANNKVDLETLVAGRDGISAWVHSHAGGDEGRRRIEATVLEVSETIKQQRSYLRSSANNWKASIGK